MAFAGRGFLEQVDQRALHRETVAGKPFAVDEQGARGDAREVVAHAEAHARSACEVCPFGEERADARRDGVGHDEQFSGGAGRGRDGTVGVFPADAGKAPLDVAGGYTVKGERGTRNTANEEALRALERLDFIRTLTIVPGERVSFRFRDLNTRAWLRDVGSVLELYTYKACLDSGIFHDVISSAVVRWDDVVGHSSVSNEIDVMAARGVVPLFLSCKACDIKTEALNEIAILRDRFGGKGAKAVIVTTEPCHSAARHRDAQLGIAVIDLEELKTGQLVHRLKVVMKAE